MTYWFSSTEYDPSSDEFSKVLDRAWASKQRLQCSCSKPRPYMYVAKVSGTFIVKRMPGTGHLHAPGCHSYMPPEGISGLSQALDGAIEHSELDDLTYIKLDFALSQTGKRMMLPPPSGDGATEAETPARKLSLTGLLHYLWHEADLVKWTPRMEGKRHWGVIQYNLMNASSGLIAKNNPLMDRLYIPESFNVDLKTERAGRRAGMFAKLKPGAGSKTELGLVVAEYKSHEPSRFGSKFTFKHMPDCSFFADTELVVRFERIFEEMMDLVAVVDGSHLIVIATFSVSKTGFPVLQQIAAMPVTRNWIPFEDMDDVALLDHMVEERRQFIKSLRFNLPKGVPISCVMLTDTDQPVACFIGDDASDDELEEGFPKWIWSGDSTIPVLPLCDHQY